MMRWIKNLFKKKKREPMYVDGDYLVQDWRGYVMSQEDHTRAWGFEGYPATHGTECTCQHCEGATTNYRINTGYSIATDDYTPTRRRVYDYINHLNSENSNILFVGYNSEGIIKERDFSPKKKIKAHKLVERKRVMRRPGVYTREIDHSTIDLTTYPSSIMNLVQVLGRERRNRDE